MAEETIYLNSSHQEKKRIRMHCCIAPWMDWWMKPLVVGKFWITTSLQLFCLQVSITAALLGSPRCPPHLLVSDTRREIIYREEGKKAGSNDSLLLLFHRSPWWCRFHPAPNPTATQILSCLQKHDSFGRKDRSPLWRVRQINECGSDLEADTFILPFFSPCWSLDLWGSQIITWQHTSSSWVQVEGGAHDGFSIISQL